MTQSTEQDRAEFEAWWRGYTKSTKAPRFEGGAYIFPAANTAWNTWQAARRAPAAPVPKFSRIAQKKLDYLLEAGEAITGYAIENKDGRRGAIDCHGFVYWWQDAAAPQPPEADMGIPISVAAPVQLPEPAAVVLSKFGTTCMFPSTEINKGAKLYTEQQVRQLLAAHGIKEQST